MREMRLSVNDSDLLVVFTYYANSYPILCKYMYIFIHMCTNIYIFISYIYIYKNRL